jgi:hypothetical protein
MVARELCDECFLARDVSFCFRNVSTSLYGRFLPPVTDRSLFIPKGAIAARRAIAALRRGTHLGLLASN